MRLFNFVPCCFREPGCPGRVGVVYVTPSDSQVDETKVFLAAPAISASEVLHQGVAGVDCLDNFAGMVVEFEVLVHGHTQDSDGVVVFNGLTSQGDVVGPLDAVVGWSESDAFALAGIDSHKSSFGPLLNVVGALLNVVVDFLE